MHDDTAGDTQSNLEKLDQYLASWLMPALLAGVTIVVIAAIIIGAAADDTRREFGEGGFITHLSALALMGLSALCFAIFLQRRGRAPLTEFTAPYNVWIIAAAAFFFLAFDEEFEIHENLDVWIHDLLGITETSLTDRIDDVLVLGYALLAIIAAIAWRREILASPVARQMFVAALAIIAVMIVIDAFTNRESTLDALFPSDTASSLHTALFVVEDSLKVYAEAFIALGFVAALRHAGWPGGPTEVSSS